MKPTKRRSNLSRKNYTAPPPLRGAAAPGSTARIHSRSMSHFADLSLQYRLAFWSRKSPLPRMTRHAQRNPRARTARETPPEAPARRARQAVRSNSSWTTQCPRRTFLSVCGRRFRSARKGASSPVRNPSSPGQGTEAFTQRPLRSSFNSCRRQWCGRGRRLRLLPGRTRGHVSDRHAEQLRPVGYAPAFVAAFGKSSPAPR